MKISWPAFKAPNIDDVRLTALPGPQPSHVPPFSQAFVFQSNSHTSLCLFGRAMPLKHLGICWRSMPHTPCSTAQNYGSGPRWRALPWPCGLHIPSEVPFLMCELCCLWVAVLPLLPIAWLFEIGISVVQMSWSHKSQRGEGLEDRKKQGMWHMEFVQNHSDACWLQCWSSLSHIYEINSPFCYCYYLFWEVFVLLEHLAL